MAPQPFNFIGEVDSEETSISFEPAPVVGQVSEVYPIANLATALETLEQEGVLAT